TAPPSSCRCRAVPRRSSSRASLSVSAASGRRHLLSGVLARPPRQGSSAAAAPPAARLRPPARNRRRRTDPPSESKRLSQKLPVALDRETPPPRRRFRHLPELFRRIDLLAVNLANDVARLQAETRRRRTA